VPRPPQTWTEKELQRDAEAARRLFVSDRLAALGREQAAYESGIRAHAETVRELLARTHDLSKISARSINERAVLDIARYVVVPPISLDDLDTLTDAPFGRWVGQTTERGARPSETAFETAAKVISERLDRERASWLKGKRGPTAAERDTFARWTAGLRASGEIQTARRMESSTRQEGAARAAAQKARYNAVTPPATLADPIKEMPPASYASASRRLADTNMDIPVRLKDGHGTGLLFLALEAKVSNSTLNSRKRLLEVLRKRERWDASGKLYRFRTGAVLAGVYDVRRLIEAQDGGVFVFWEHRLSDLTAFLR
jgi:hypothetical protein